MRPDVPDSQVRDIISEPSIYRNSCSKLLTNESPFGRAVMSSARSAVPPMAAVRTLVQEEPVRPCSITGAIFSCHLVLTQIGVTLWLLHRFNPK